MHEIAIMLALASLGVDYGWKVSDDGEAEYIIQIEPELVRALVAGESITSQVDPRVSNVRRFRICVGNEPLAQEVPPAALVTGSARPLDSMEATEQGTLPAAAGGLSEPAAESPPDPAVAPNSPAPADGADGVGGDGPAQPIADPNAPMADGRGIRGTRFELDPGSEARADGNESSATGRENAQDASGTLGGAIDNTLPRQQGVGFDADQVVGEGTVNKRSSTETSGSPQTVTPARDAVPAPSADGPPRRWLPLTVTLLALFASIGLNLYLGWNSWDTYRRYQSLLSDVRTAGSHAAAS
jgi:hypothetical protein